MKKPFAWRKKSNSEHVDRQSDNSTSELLPSASSPAQTRCRGTQTGDNIGAPEGERGRSRTRKDGSTVYLAQIPEDDEAVDRWLTPSSGPNLKTEQSASSLSKKVVNKGTMVEENPFLSEEEKMLGCGCACVECGCRSHQGSGSRVLGQRGYSANRNRYVGK